MDAQIIGALHDSEVMETGEEGGDVVAEDDEGGDLLGEELLEMEASHKQCTEETRGREDMATREKLKQSSSHRGGGRARLPMGVQSKKGEFLRRGSPRGRRASSKDLSNAVTQRPETSKSSNST
ncbi:unnamed protein product, partial [Eruca vesicaria subsp. sativa]|nr:unnamed protein product [Eruca vesicaria subsp. sativa]